MILKEYSILAAEGLHARPATELTRLVKKYKSAITIRKGSQTVLIKGILSILSLAAKCGDEISVTIDGLDEGEAAMALDTFFKRQSQDI